MCKWIRVTSMTLFLMIGVIHNVYSSSEHSKIVLKGKAPEGIVIGKNKVTLKKGFMFEKLQNGRVVSRMKGRQGGITGDFDCTCNGSGGGCSIITTPTSVSCFSSGCNNCYMIVTIPGQGGIKILSR